MLHAGCQIVALNYQDKKPETQIYKALFKNNGGCGYLLKPAYMREDGSDGLTLEQREKQRHPITLKIGMISGQQLPKPPGDEEDVSDPYVVVQIYGSPRDCNRQSTSYVRNNGEFVPHLINFNCREIYWISNSVFLQQSGEYNREYRKSLLRFLEIVF